MTKYMYDNREKIIYYEREISYCERKIEEYKLRIVKANKNLEKIKNGT